MSTFLRFELGSDFLQFEYPAQYPAERPVKKYVVTDRTAAGVLQREDLSITTKQRTLYFEDMSKDNYDALVNWFENIAQGSKNAFTMIDERQYTGTVVILDDEINFPEIDFELHTGQMTVEYI